MSPDARRTRRPRTRDYATAGSQLSGTLAQSALQRGAAALSPHFGFLVLAGVGIASLRLTHPLRLTLMWLVELVLVLLYAQTGKLKSSYSTLNLARGLLVGIVVSLPLYVSSPTFFHATASWLYGVKDLQVLLERAVFIVPLLEGLYFRGAVQRERGLVTGAVLYGLAQGLIVMSAGNAYPLVVLALVLGMILAGLLYGYLYQRYGLTTSIAGHVAVSFVLFVLPALSAAIAPLIG